MDPDLEPTLVGLLTPAFEEHDAQSRLDPGERVSSFDRSRRDFSERGLDVLDIFLPHLKRFPAPRGGSARRRCHADDREALTPRDREILELVAEGRTP